MAAERIGSTPKTVREFVGEFRGLSATTKQKTVSAEANLERAYLHDLVADKQLDKVAIRRLRKAMQANSKPVKPESLGILGESHFRRLLVKAGPSVGDDSSLQEGENEEFLQKPDDGSAQNTFRYSKLSEINEEGLPCVVEVAFCITQDPKLQGVHFGLNWSATLGNPLEGDRFGLNNDDRCYGFCCSPTIG